MPLDQQPKSSKLSNKLQGVTWNINAYIMPSTWKVAVNEIT